MEFNVITTPPKVFLVSQPSINWDAVNAYLAHRGVEWNVINENLSDVELLYEMAGRVCYQSWHNPADRTTDGYVSEQLIGRDHGSPLEHGMFCFLVADLPRSAQLELVRHGDGTGFSFESTRFTDTHLRFVAPPHIRQNASEVEMFTAECFSLTMAYERRVKELTAFYKPLYYGDKTLAGKRAKEAARSILPNSQGSDGMVSMNARALRWIIECRSDEHADLSIREFAHAVYEAVKPILKGMLADATEVSATEGPPAVVFSHRKV